MILLIDNYDSFTYNLYHYLIEAGTKAKKEEEELNMFRKLKISFSQLQTFQTMLKHFTNAKTKISSKVLIIKPSM
jgi:anthranilate/para-aminobenzoate synthase component II